MKHLFLFLLFLIPVLLSAQDPLPANPRKQRLGYQTTGEGIFVYGNGVPGYTPTKLRSAYHYMDTTNNVLYQYDRINSEWDTLRVNDSQQISIDSSGRVFTITMEDGGSVQFEDIDTDTQIDTTNLSSRINDNVQALQDTAAQIRADMGSVGIADGDKGDITVASSGTVWTVNENVIDSSNVAPAALSLTELAPSGATSGDILQFNGSQYAPFRQWTGAESSDSVYINSRVAIGPASPFQLRGKLNVFGGVVFNDLSDNTIIGSTVDEDSIVAINTSGDRNVFLGHRDYLTGEIPVRRKATDAETSVMIGPGNSIGAELIGSVNIGFQNSAFSVMNGSTNIGYVTGRNSYADNSLAIGYKAGINSHGYENTFLGYLQGRNLIGDRNIRIGSGSGGGGPRIDTLTFSPSDVDTVNQRIYIPSHGITDSVFVAQVASTGTVFVEDGKVESTRLKFSVINADSIEPWRFTEYGSYYGSYTPLRAGTGTHSIYVQKKLNNTILINTDGQINVENDNEVVIGNELSRLYRFGEDFFLFPGTNSGANILSNNHRTLTYDYYNRRFSLSDSISSYGQLTAYNDGNGVALKLMPTVNNKPSRLHITGIASNGTESTFQFFGSQAGSFTISKIGLSNNSIVFGSNLSFSHSTTAGSGNFVDSGNFTITSTGGDEIRGLRIDRPTTSGNARVGVFMVNGTGSVATDYRFFSGNYRFRHLQDTTGGVFPHFSWTTTTGTEQERMRLTNDGKLGVGTTTPTASLDVSGSGRIRSMSDSAAMYVVRSDADGNLYRDSLGAGQLIGSDLDFSGLPIDATIDGDEYIVAYDPDVGEGEQLLEIGNMVEKGTQWGGTLYNSISALDTISVAFSVMAHTMVFSAEVNTSGSSDLVIRLPEMTNPMLGKTIVIPHVWDASGTYDVQVHSHDSTASEIWSGGSATSVVTLTSSGAYRFVAMSRPSDSALYWKLIAD